MDLRSCKLRFTERQVRAVVADASGERGRDLEGAAAQRVLAAAEPLRAAVAPGARALSIDALERVLRASTGDAERPGVRVAGDGWRALEGAVREVARAILIELLPQTEVPGGPSDPAFWSGIWRAGRDGWELARPAPPLARWVAAQRAPLGRALVVGCGRGHEARMLADAGADVIAVDLAAEAIAAARALGGLVDFRQVDLFDLPAARERFDLALEHTCFCAIDPARRAEYAGVMGQVVVSGGRLVGLFWQHGRAGGPPFSTTPDEVAVCFAPWFEIASSEIAPDSVASRAGQEWLTEMRRR